MKKPFLKNSFLNSILQHPKVKDMTTKKKTVLALVTAVVLVSGYVFAQGYDGLIAPQKGAGNIAGTPGPSIAVSPAPAGAATGGDIYSMVKGTGPSTPESRRDAMMEQQRARLQQRQKDLEALRAAQQQNSLTTFNAAKARLEEERQKSQGQ